MKELGKKIDRSFVIDDQLMCICNISKDAIFMIIVDKNNMFLGYEGLKKVTDFFTKNSKLELFTKKYLETSIMLEEFLYSRELPISKLTLSFVKQEQQISYKKTADQEQLNKFPHLTQELEKNLIANIPLKYAKKQQIQDKDQTLITSLASITELIGLDSEETEWNQQQRLFNYATAFKLKSKVIPKDGQNRYQNKLPALAQKKVDSSQKSQTQYMSISSSDMQVIQQKFRQSKIINLLGQEEVQPSIKTGKSVSAHVPQQQVKNQTQIAKDLLDLDDLGNSQQLAPQIKHDSGNKSALPMDLDFQVRKNEVFQQVPQAQSIQNKQRGLSQNDFIVTQQSQNSPNQRFSVESPSPSPIQIYSDQQLQSLDYVLRMVEKMILIQKDGKLKEIKMFGQITLEGDFSFTGQEELILLGKDWNDDNGCQKRISPNSIQINQIRENAYRQFFSQQCVPMILIYKLDVSPQDQRLISFCLQYKVNDSWFTPLYDVEIEINLQQDVQYEEQKSIPMANSIQGNVVIWKAQQLIAQQKGKLVLNLNGINKAPLDILDFIKVSVKTNCSILNQMNCLIIHPNTNQEQAGQKRLVVEYKILPNQY